MAKPGFWARPDPSRTSLCPEARRPLSVLLALVALTWVTGCATSGAGSRHSTFQGEDAFALTRAEVRPAHPVKIEWAMGQAKPGAVIRTTFVAPIIVADSVVQLLRTHEFTGWSQYEVSVWDKQGQEIPGYSGLAITGRCGNIDNAQSIEVPRIFPGGIFPVRKGIFFDPMSWDGSDLFMPAGFVGWKFVVEEVKKAFERAKITNVRFTPLEQVERDWD